MNIDLLLPASLIYNVFRSLRASISKRGAKRSDSYKIAGRRGGAASPDEAQQQQQQQLQQLLQESGVDRDSAGGGNGGRASGSVGLRVSVGARVSPTNGNGGGGGATTNTGGALRVSPATQPQTPGAAPATRRASSSVLAGHGAPDGVSARTYSTSHGGAANGVAANANGARHNAAGAAAAAPAAAGPADCVVQSFCRPSEPMSDGAGLDGPDSFGPEELTSLPPPRSCPNCYTSESPSGAPGAGGVAAGPVDGSALGSVGGTRRSNSNLAATAPRDASVTGGTGRQAAARRGSAGGEAAWAAAQAALVVPPSPRPPAAAQPPASPATAAPPSPASAATAAAQKAQQKAAAAAAAAVAAPAAPVAAPAPAPNQQQDQHAAQKPAAAAAADTAPTWVLRPGPPVESAYELGDVLGKGSFGVVRRARHIASGAQVAIKVRG